MRLFPFRRTKIRLNDGTVVEIAHRYALRIIIEARQYSIGFEDACEPDVDRIIHKNSIERVEGACQGDFAISDEERSTLILKVVEFCAANRYSYRIEE
jgi:hypothetical protein